MQAGISSLDCRVKGPAYQQDQLAIEHPLLRPLWDSQGTWAEPVYVMSNSFALLESVLQQPGSPHLSISPVTGARASIPHRRQGLQCQGILVLIERWCPGLMRVCFFLCVLFLVPEPAFLGSIPLVTYFNGLAFLLKPTRWGCKERIFQKTKIPSLVNK